MQDKLFIRSAVSIRTGIVQFTSASVARLMIGTALIFVVHASYAQVVSMSRVTEVQTDAGSYRQFSVNCGSRSTPRFVRKQSNSALWCDALSGEFCARQRLKAAGLVCSRRYTVAAQELNQDSQNTQNADQLSTSDQPEPNQQGISVQSESLSAPPVIALSENDGSGNTEASAPSDNELAKNTITKAELETELRNIEQQLIDIQAKTLELRAKDLKLMKQQLGSAE